MSIQAFPATLPGVLVDPKTGNIDVNASKFLLALLNRTGMQTGIVPIVSDPLAATGTTIDGALELTDDWNLVETTPANAGVRILFTGAGLKPGNDITVWNLGANNLNVYPPNANTQIDALGNGSPFVLIPGKLRVFQCWTVPPDPGRFASFGN